MKFISAEEFLKQPKEIQKVFIDWWEPQLFDLYIFDKRIIEIVRTSDENMILPCKSNNIWEEKKHCIPLLTEGQLRKFIEDKTNSKIDMMFFKNGYDFELFSIGKLQDEFEAILPEGAFEELPCSLLQAYWKVALEIAREGKDNE